MIIKNVIFYPAPHAEHHKKAMALLANGFKTHGIHYQTRKPLEPGQLATACDLAVIWGHGKRHQVLIDQMRARSKPYLVIEMAYVGNRTSMYSLGFNGLNGRAVFPTINDNGRRWNTLFPNYLKPWQVKLGSYGLIMGQCRGDAAIKHVDFQHWLYQRAAEIIKAGFLPRYRPHPKAPNTWNDPAPRIYGTLHGALEVASIVVTYNSNSAVDALLMGVPTVAMDQGSMAWSIADKKVSAKPNQPSREAWAHQLAWCQWLPSELENGTAWSVLSNVLQEQAA